VLECAGQEHPRHPHLRDSVDHLDAGAGILHLRPDTVELFSVNNGLFDIERDGGTGIAGRAFNRSCGMEQSLNGQLLASRGE
jgi:hypothetical protein